MLRLRSRASFCTCSMTWGAMVYLRCLVAVLSSKGSDVSDQAFSVGMTSSAILLLSVREPNSRPQHSSG